MTDNADYSQLVRHARLGDREGLNLLSHRVRGELYTYIYRITLDFNLTEDISQETLLEMVRSLKNLRDVNRFKAWLFQIASTKIKKHYRVSGNRRIMSQAIINSDKLAEQAEGKPGALCQLMRNEMSSAIADAMTKLKHSYRNILVLRCFEQMSYPDIAYTLGCSSIQAQLLFFRAKHSLKRHLARQGYKKEHLLASLGVFAAMTAVPFKSASALPVRIVPATLKVGMTAAVVGAVTTKTGIIASILMTSAILTVSGTAIYKNVSKAGFHIVATEQIGWDRLRYPSAVADAFNPQGNKWFGSVGSNHYPVPASLEQWLTRPPPEEKNAVVIPEKGWVKLKFSSPVVNGPGDDIVIIEKCKAGEKADVFLADDDNNEIFVGSVNVPRTYEHTPTIFGCDIAGLKIPFKPTSIRILTTDNGFLEHKDALPGFDLISVRANLSGSQ